MVSPNERFPRAAIFAQAAELQERLEYWQGITAKRMHDAEDMQFGEIIVRKFKARYDALDKARELATQARQNIYLCP